MRRLLRFIRCRLFLLYYRTKNVHKTVYISKRCALSRDITADEYVYIGPGCRIGPGVFIGAYSMVGPGVNFTGDDHIYDKPGVPVIFSGRPKLRKTVVGRDVWIGTNAVIMAGVTIGNGAIIAAGAVVNSDINDCEVHAGIPSRKIKNRFMSERDKMIHLEMLNKPVKIGDFCQKKCYE